MPRSALFAAQRPGLRIALAVALATAGAARAAAEVPACNAMGGVTVPTVVELYTSEGCNSCPPADRWLASLKGRPGVVRLAFHVDYWDRLGWKDRFAEPAYTLRQNEVSRRAGGRFVYTPQVVVDGADWRDWPSLPRAATPRPATVHLTLVADDAGYLARIVRGPGAPIRLAGFWAVTEDGHVSAVKSGENAGVTLQHDAVVREFVELPAIGDAPLRFAPRTAAGAGVQRRVQFVVTDGQTARPLQAAACPA